jgi:hypothetical protein
MKLTINEALLRFGEQVCFPSKDGTAILCNYIRYERRGYAVARDNGGWMKILRLVRRLRWGTKKTAPEMETVFNADESSVNPERQ